MSARYRVQLRLGAVVMCIFLGVGQDPARGVEGSACLDNSDCHLGEVCTDQGNAQQGTCVKPCSWPTLVLSISGTEAYTTDEGQFTSYKLRIANWKQLPDTLFQPAPDLPPCGQNANASRSWLDIFDGTTDQRIYGFCALSSAQMLGQETWFGVQLGAQPPTKVFVKLVDRRTGRLYCSNMADTATVP